VGSCSAVASAWCLVKLQKALWKIDNGIGVTENTNRQEYSVNIDVLLFVTFFATCLVGFETRYLWVKIYTVMGCIP
jgi:hypothetical protein